MDSSKKFKNPSPELKANFVNRLFYCWVLPFFKYGYQNDLKVKDIYNSVKSDFSGPLADALESNWQTACKNSKDGKPKLQPVIFKTFWKSYCAYGFFLFVQSVVIKGLTPIALASYIKYHEKSCGQKDARTGWMLGLGVVALAFSNVLIWHYCGLGLARVGMRVRIAACSIIYRKLIRLNQSSLGQVAAGKLVNLLSNDVSRFEYASIFLHYYWLTPIQTAVSLYIMYSYIGLASLPAMGTIIVQCVLLQGYLSKQQGKYRSKIAHLTDSRVKIMSEITSGIQVIKMYSWEQPFEKVVELARKTEMKAIRLTSYIQGFTIALRVFTERATLFIAILTFVLMGNVITGEVVFSLAQLINTVQLYLSIMLPNAFSAYAEMKVTMKRIEEFLHLDENENIAHVEVDCCSDSSTKLNNVTATWLPNSITPTLSNINFELKPGTLCCVVGSVGSGKSSLLQVLLKELPLNQGSMEVNGKISYAAQEPWLFVSNVRQNILFGSPYIKTRYKEVTKVCALERDFKQLSHGDQTLVGERGAALSGGQRARVALARAVYREADIYLLDDPLSAVDTHVAKHLFDECVTNYLRGKTRILVTHQVQFLKGADVIVVINNGKIDKIGTYNDLSENELSNLSKELGKSTQEIQKRRDSENELIIIKTKKEINNLQSVTSLTSSKMDEEPKESDELIEKGTLSGDIYSKYFKSGASIFSLVFVAFLLVIAQVACNASDMWIKYWSNVLEEKQTNENFTCKTLLNKLNSTSIVLNNFTMSSTESTTEPNYEFENITKILELFYTKEETLSRDMFLYVYLILIIASCVLTSVRSIWFMKICMRASTNLHNTMFAKILRAPMRFFDTNPSGRILNRFSKDIGAVDEILPRCMLDSLQVFLVMAGILGMVFIVSPWMILPAMVLGSLFLFARYAYLASAQDIKRLEGITKAPIFSHVSASLYGLSTIRAFDTESLVIKEFDELQDVHTGTTFLFIATSEALGFYLDVISTVFLSLVTFQFLLFYDNDTPSGNVGLVISQSLILTGMLQYGIRQSAEVSSNMTSVERVLQYTRLEEEGPWEPLPADKPPSAWPQKGRVLYKNVYLRYDPEMAPALKNLNVEIKPGDKVGVVGRTGAGKSTLVASLFRLAPIDGTVALDDLDTAKVGLKNLRSNISIIPQMPTLFSSTIRYNLDPFGRSADDVLWQALNRVELHSAITSLDMPVSEGGSNFSAGQRQLLCLARAIVRNNKVLVMDEATANVDPHTDSLIQKTIRECFKNCTVITVAHRLNTIIDSDKVLVMEFGEAVEFSSPYELLQNPNSYFSAMVRETGSSMENKLRTLADTAFKMKTKME